MTTLTDAIILAAAMHEDQTDRAGEDYILHPLRVMLAVAPEHRVAAVLHDTVEDSILTVEDIEARFGRDVAATVDALTRRPGESYSEFIERCAGSRAAAAIKLADISDNLSPCRRAGLTPSLEARYRAAMARLAA